MLKVRCNKRYEKKKWSIIILKRGNIVLNVLILIMI